MAQARSFYERSLGISRDLGDQFGVALSLHALGKVAAGQRDFSHARSFHEESLRIRRQLGDRRGIAESLEAFALLAEALGDPRGAARLLGAAEAQRDLIHAPPSSAEDGAGPASRQQSAHPA